MTDLDRPNGFWGKLKVFRPNSAQRPFVLYSHFLVCPRSLFGRGVSQLDRAGSDFSMFF